MSSDKTAQTHLKNRNNWQKNGNVNFSRILLAKNQKI